MSAGPVLFISAVNPSAAKRRKVIGNLVLTIGRVTRVYAEDTICLKQIIAAQSVAQDGAAKRRGCIDPTEPERVLTEMGVISSSGFPRPNIRFKRSSCRLSQAGLV